MFRTSVDAAWQILLALGAGTGAVFMLRWFWWRINAWSEIVSMFGSLAFFLSVDPIAASMGFDPPRPEEKMFFVAVATIILWLVVTYITPPETDATLDAFYRKIRPGGNGWKPVAQRNPDVKVDTDLKLSIAGALAATGIVYSALPGMGNLIFGHYTSALICGVVALVFTVIVAAIVSRLCRESTARANDDS
jgi:uncharacterized membrane protein